ncbi:MAG: amidohydrolase [Ruminococcaceae bacterium]|nr:amidohydrolase [Oscillospiraceae bacterium]
METYAKIKSVTDAMTDEMIATRRDFHKYAEAGWFEMRTSSIIARKLTEMGVDEVLVGEQVCKKDARMGVAAEDVLEANYQRAVEQDGDPEFLPYTRGGMTGVIGIIRCGEGPTVAMRFDIDALGVIEEQEASHRPAAEGFVSINRGMMHACGHDGHATIGLGVAKTLMAIRDQLHGTVKLIFQPSEEGVRGAKSIVDNGHLDGVDFLIGAHVTGKSNPDDPAVVVPCSHGSLATAKYDIIFHGLAAHAGASPEKGKNVMLAVAAAITNLYAIPRNSGGMTRINVGTVRAGSGRNVIADEAVMEIELRGETTELNDYVVDYARNIVAGAAAMHGCTYEMKLMGAAQSMTSDAELGERIRRVCGEMGLPVSEIASSRNGGSEDFSYMMTRVQEQGGQATFMRVLTKTAAVAHNRRYDFDEAVLPNSVKIFCGTVYDIMK